MRKAQHEQEENEGLLFYLQERLIKVEKENKALLLEVASARSGKGSQAETNVLKAKIILLEEGLKRAERLVDERDKKEQERSQLLKDLIRQTQAKDDKIRLLETQVRALEAK